MIKLKVREFQLRHHTQPEKVVVKLSELEDKVRRAYNILVEGVLMKFLQAKDHDIFDTKPFLRSKLFSTNGYILGDKVIEKHFKMDEE